MASFDLDPLSKSSLTMKLYKNVRNVSEIRKKLMNGSLKCCVVKPSLVIDPFQIVVAANKAVVAEKMTTKSVYTEILFNLSISKNISQSLQKFGVADGETDALVIVVNQESVGGVEEVFSQIDGEEIAVSELDRLKNDSAVKKAYKISENELKDVPLLDSVISRIATKDFVSH